MFDIWMTYPETPDGVCFYYAGLKKEKVPVENESAAKNMDPFRILCTVLSDISLPKSC
ncbi:hypothetical protein LJC57_05990 [Parabacteroides sp. OttesenSCG-928-G07]|nr:hypothetical protein [Parabacteroides sp. OttesenSCG-928-G21]MDL2278125.1 hypothetical protein [Parabacteroides sp. OttesenSCG-928-G07]